MINRKGFALIIITPIVIIIAIIAIGAYLFLSNPKKYLVDDKIKSDTNHEGLITDKISPRTEIKESGYNLEVVVEPSDNNVISGTVTITAGQVDEHGAGVGFFLSETKEQLTQGGMPSLGIDRDGQDGWSNTWDTTEFENGKYYINVVVYPPGGEGNPLGVAQIPAEIKN